MLRCVHSMVKCCVFWPANWCFACSLLVENIFFNIFTAYQLLGIHKKLIQRVSSLKNVMKSTTKKPPQKTRILTSVLSVQHPNTGRNIQQINIVFSSIEALTQAWSMLAFINFWEKLTNWILTNWGRDESISLTSTVDQ